MCCCLLRHQGGALQNCVLAHTSAKTLILEFKDKQDKKGHRLGFDFIGEYFPPRKQQFRCKPFLQNPYFLAQGPHDSADIHRQSFHRWRLSGRLRVHTRGETSCRVLLRSCATYSMFATIMHKSQHGDVLYVALLCYFFVLRVPSNCL